MGHRTKIDWCDATWNPVTGCLHGCEYCYARKIAERFRGCILDLVGDSVVVRDGCGKGPIYELNNPVSKVDGIDPVLGSRVSKAPYPFSFSPTFHRYRLDIPARWTKPRTIFVCSMADLFGDWVPDEWIEQVFKACEAAPQHRYLFLTKNPKRYVDLYVKDILRVHDSFWYGSTITNANDRFYYSRMPDDNPHTFCSVEPIFESIGFEPIGTMRIMPDWVIVGAETGNRKGKVVPRKEWIDEIAAECKRHRKPLFMKDSLRGLMGDDFRQELPWRAEG